MTTDVDPRRLVPRTDAVLADPAVRAAVERLGAAVVKRAVAAAQEQVRSGALSPADVVAAALSALPASLEQHPTGAQRDRGRAAHQPRPGAAVVRRRRGAARRGRIHRRRVRPGDRPPGPPRSRHPRRLGRRGAGRRGRPRRQQRRRRPGPRHDGARRRPRGGGQPRRDGRDRRRVPAARPDRLDRRPAARGRHHQPHAPGRLRRRGRCRTPVACSRCTRATSGWRGSPPPSTSPTWPPSAYPWSWTSAADCWRRTRCCPTSPTPTPRCAPARRWSRPAATSCSAGRRPAWCCGRRRARRAVAPAPAGPGAAGGQDHPGGPGGDPARSGHADLAGAARGSGRAAPACGTARGRARRAGVEAEVVPSDGAVGGGGAPGLVLAGWAVALPEACGRAAAAGRTGRGRPGRAGPMPARPALRAGRMTTRSSGAPC